MFPWLSVQSSFLLGCNFVYSKFQQYKASKRALSCVGLRAFPIPPHPGLFVSSLWFFLKFSLEQHDKPIHKQLHYSCPPMKKNQTTKHHRAQLWFGTVFLISNDHLIFFCLFWYDLISWQNFDSGKHIHILCAWSKRTHFFSHTLKGFVCLFNFSLSAEPSEDGRQQKERSPPEHTSARTPPSTPIKIEEGTFFWFGGQGKPVTASLVTDAWKCMN